MNKLIFVSILLSIALAALSLTRLQEPPKSVKLERTYKEGESQDYTFSVTSKPPFAEGQEMKISGEATVRVVKLLSDGKAELESKVTKLTLNFMGQDNPAPELPEPETDVYGKNGVPVKVEFKEDDDPFFAIPFILVDYVPASEVEIGATFPLKYQPEGNQLTVEGEGKLVATGRLYEERVAKLEIKAKGTTKDGIEADVQYTSYMRLDNGRLVKAEGTSKAKTPDGEEIEIKFLIAKVRTK